MKTESTEYPSRPLPAEKSVQYQSLYTAQGPSWSFFWQIRADGAMKSAIIVPEFVMNQEAMSAHMKAILNQLRLDPAH